jgi:hypothetical protein
MMFLAMVAVVPAATAQESALAGNWQLKIVSPQGNREPSLLLTQKGQEVTGTYKGMRGDAPIAGTVTGNQFSLTVKLGTGDNTMVVEFKGKVEGTTLAGMVMMGQRGEAPFTGTRAP